MDNSMLRLFAGHALVGLSGCYNGTPQSAEQIARHCFDLAEAMCVQYEERSDKFADEWEELEEDEVWEPTDPEEGL